MFDNYHFTAAERFLRYVQIDTQSDPYSSLFPTTEKQKNLSNLLSEELREMGIADAGADEYGYVYATIPSNTDKQVPTICFCSHVDTAPDCNGTNVKPILHKAYSGEDILLPDDTTQIISTEQYPYLKDVLLSIPIVFSTVFCHARSFLLPDLRLMCTSCREDNRIGSAEFTVPPHTPGPPPHWHEMVSLRRSPCLSLHVYEDLYAAWNVDDCQTAFREKLVLLNTAFKLMRSHSTMRPSL